MYVLAKVRRTNSGDVFVVGVLDGCNMTSEEQRLNHCSDSDSAGPQETPRSLLSLPLQGCSRINDYFYNLRPTDSNVFFTLLKIGEIMKRT